MDRMGKRDKMPSPKSDEQTPSLWKKFKKAFQKRSSQEETPKESGSSSMSNDPGTSAW